jgi:hypothetical protein
VKGCAHAGRELKFCKTGSRQLLRENVVQTYTVHEPPEPSADRIDRGAELLFVKDGFSWMTAIFPPFGLAMAQLWVPLAAYIAVVGIGTAAMTAFGLSENWISLAVTAVNIFVGFEQSTLQRWTLDQAGYQMLGTVTGKNLDECERRFLEEWLPSQPMVAPPADKSRSNAGSWTGALAR